MSFPTFSQKERIPWEDPLWVRVVTVMLVLAIFPAGWLFWHLITPEAKVVRSQVISPAPDGCTAEVWVEGKAGDHLSRLMEYYKNRRPPKFVKAVVSHENMTSTRLPERVGTPAGNCEIIRWHLLIGGTEADSVRK